MKKLILILLFGSVFALRSEPSKQLNEDYDRYYRIFFKLYHQAYQKGAVNAMYYQYNQWKWEEDSLEICLAVQQLANYID